MDTILSAKRVTSFSRLLAAYATSGNPLRNAVDGGAGSGNTAEQMIKHLTADSAVYAFEPFPGNHRFFVGCDERIVLHTQALAEGSRTVTFNVPAVVSEDSEWGRRGMVGYSSGGRISAPGRAGLNFDVQAVAADDVVPNPDEIEFVKLDLEGGEVNALRGMPRILTGARFLWCEFKGQPELLEELAALELVLFDTEYLFYDSPSPEALEHFDMSRRGMTMSSGREAWTGFRRREWSDYLGIFADFKQRFSMVQTDLVCANRAHLDSFVRMLPCL